MSESDVDLAAVPFLKGHGTGNDFVLIPDLDGRLDLTSDHVAAICDRHFGVGADGILRVVRSAADDESAEFAPDAEFFMDFAYSCGLDFLIGSLLSAAEETPITSVNGCILGSFTQEDGYDRVVMGLQP